MVIPAQFVLIMLDPGLNSAPMSTSYLLIATFRFMGSIDFITSEPGRIPPRAIPLLLFF